MPLTNHARITGQGTGGPTPGQLKAFFTANSVPDNAQAFIGGLELPQSGQPQNRPDGWAITFRW